MPSMCEWMCMSVLTRPLSTARPQMSFSTESYCRCSTMHIYMCICHSPHRHLNPFLWLFQCLCPCFFLFYHQFALHWEREFYSLLLFISQMRMENRKTTSTKQSSHIHFRLFAHVWNRTFVRCFAVIICSSIRWVPVHIVSDIVEFSCNGY